MGVQGDRIFAAITQKGFPDPWSAFGECLSWESAYAVQLKQAIDQARKGPDEHLSQTVSELFDTKAGNLAHARKLLDDVLIEYDESGMWQVLDERTLRLDIDDVSERWARGLVEHPFPIALLSLQFNWRYMKDQGVRAFYEMTARYVDDLSANTRRWVDAWTRPSVPTHFRSKAPALIRCLSLRQAGPSRMSLGPSGSLESRTAAQRSMFAGRTRGSGCWLWPFFAQADGLRS